MTATVDQSGCPIEETLAAVACICGSLQPSLLASRMVGAKIQALADPIDANSRFFREWHRCALPVNAGFVQWVAQEAAGMPAAVWQALFAMMEATDLRQIAKQAFASVLLLAGGEDTHFGELLHLALREAFPEAGTEILTGHSHNPHWESPQRVADALRGLLL